MVLVMRGIRVYVRGIDDDVVGKIRFLIENRLKCERKRKKVVVRFVVRSFYRDSEGRVVECG